MTTERQHTQLPKAYDPASVEQRIYQTWEERGYFAPRIDWSKKPFVIIMPPPNVTGELHQGHALTATLEDIMVRWHRMRGEPTLWLPGTDHAGIATQVVVERELAKEGRTRHDLGRERFLGRVWDWVHRYGGYITQQHKRLGASCDWTRERFTLDAGPSKAVRTTFANLYHKGLIYRGERIINWCPRCATALSDLEVEHEAEASYLYYIRYPCQDGQGHLTVATTRPETLLGDTAVAVNPTDSRYRHLLGATVLLPVLQRPLPVIADEAVDPEFGTGALKITPGHDPTDFEIGQRHNLPIISAMNLDGTMSQEAGLYQGMTTLECRVAIVRDLEAQGLLEKVEPYQHSVGHCQRCDNTVEPLVSKQWFVKVAPLAQPAMEAVTQGRIRIVPERFSRVYLNWMENLRDWCISRQLWWGHRIPVWYCDACERETVAVEDPDRCEHCGSAPVTQDPDVLDTWFSSALWPHSTLGWPEDAEDLRYFYPTTVLETAYDILFFWVARMIMMGLENQGEVPFHTVYLHGLIRDQHGVKMSKTQGNVIDPLEATKTYGTDALRFALITGTTAGNDSRLSPGKLEASRNFANKLWNAARFVILSLEGREAQLHGWSSPQPSHRHDRWILSRLRRLVVQVNRLLEEFQFSEAQREVHDFLWGEFCDWYIELAKVRMRAPDATVLPVLAHVLEQVLRLLHPFMPFVTEEVWQSLTAQLPREGELTPSIMIAPYPTLQEAAPDAEAEAEVGLVMDIVRAIRNARAELHIEANRWLEAYVDASHAADVVREEEVAIQQLARLESLHLAQDGHIAPREQVMTLVLGQATVTLPLGDVVDLAAERQRLEQERAATEETVQRLEAHLGDEQFVSKAPAEVVERERQRLASLQERGQRLDQFLAQLSQSA